MTVLRKGDLAQQMKVISVATVAWTGIALLFLIQRIIAIAARGIAPRWDRLALEIIVGWGTWAVLTPLILFIVRRLPLASAHPRRVLLHLPIGFGVGLLHSLLVATITPLFLWRPSFAPIRDMFTGRLVSAIAFEMLIYFMVAAVLYAFIYATESRQRAIAIARAERGLEQARLEAMELEGRRQQLASMLDSVTSREGETDSLVVPARDGLQRVPVDSIDWLQAEDNYVRLHVDGRSHLVRTTLGALEKRLASRDFVRIHRSAVVSVSKIAKLKRLASDRYTVVLTSGAQLRVSRAYRKQVIAAVRTPLTPE